MDPRTNSFVRQVVRTLVQAGRKDLAAAYVVQAGTNDASKAAKGVGRLLKGARVTKIQPPNDPDLYPETEADPVETLQVAGTYQGVGVNVVIVDYGADTLYAGLYEGPPKRGNNIDRIHGDVGDVVGEIEGFLEVAFN